MIILISSGACNKFKIVKLNIAESICPIEIEVHFNPRIQGKIKIFEIHSPDNRIGFTK